MDEDLLIHYGVLGMKWGVRKDKKSNTSNSSSSKGLDSGEYTQEQKKRDQRIYSKRAAKRIEKRVQKGESVQSARHPEVERKTRSENRKRVAKRVAKTAVAVVGGAAIAGASLWVANNVMKSHGQSPFDPNSNVVQTGLNFVAAYLNRWAG